MNLAALIVRTVAGASRLDEAASTAGLIASVCVILGGFVGLGRWLIRAIRRELDNAVKRLGKPNGGDGLRDAVDKALVQGQQNAIVLEAQNGVLAHHGSQLAAISDRVGAVEAAHGGEPAVAPI